MPQKHQDVETRLAAARTQLILDKPFLGALVLRLPMIEANPDWCVTTFSDGTAFYYNHHYIDALDPAQLKFALAHEALHCALAHFHRRGHRIRSRWDQACDLAINPVLVADGLKPTPDALCLSEYEGMTAEEIYPCLDHIDNGGERDEEQDSTHGDGGADREKQPLPHQAEYDSRPGEETDDSVRGVAQPLPADPQTLDALATQWQQRLAAAAQQALQAGKLDGEMARLAERLGQPVLPWRMLLARFLSATAREDYSYTRPSSRRGEPAIFPGMRSHQIDIVVALDTSGSISADSIAEFVAEVDALKGQLRARLTLLACDRALSATSPRVFEPWENFDPSVELGGGGGTDFRPVFDWVAERDTAPQALVYFTDANGKFPVQEPDYPVSWLVQGRATVPFGERIQIS